MRLIMCPKGNKLRIQLILVILATIFTELLCFRRAIPLTVQAKPTALLARRTHSDMVKNPKRPKVITTFYRPPPVGLEDFLHPTVSTNPVRLPPGRTRRRAVRARKVALMRKWLHAPRGEHVTVNVSTPLGPRPPMSDTHKANVAAAVKRWRTHPGDTGSSEVQIAVAHERIKYMTEHLLANKHDRRAKYDLTALVNQRRCHLNYLCNHGQTDKAKAIIKELGIRYHTPLERMCNRSLKYFGRHNTKNKKAETKKREKKKAKADRIEAVKEMREYKIKKALRAEQKKVRDAISRERSAIKVAEERAAKAAKEAAREAARAAAREARMKK